MHRSLCGRAQACLGSWMAQMIAGLDGWSMIGWGADCWCISVCGLIRDNQ